MTKDRGTGTSQLNARSVDNGDNSCGLQKIIDRGQLVVAEVFVVLGFSGSDLPQKIQEVFISYLFIFPNRAGDNMFSIPKRVSGIRSFETNRAPYIVLRLGVNLLKSRLPSTIAISSSP